MNSTAQPALDPKLPTGPTLVASRPPRTAAQGSWTPTDRWAWAFELPVSGIARAVAGCIAYHANARTGLGWPGMGTIATETGFCRRAVVKAIKDLERGGHVTVTRFKVGKKNTANRYQLPPMGGPSDALGGVVDGGGGSARDALPSASGALGGSAPDAPESVRTESVKNNSPARARVVCEQADDTPDRGKQVSPGGTIAACTCGDAYLQSYGRRCVACEGRPSSAQLDGARKGVPQGDSLETRGQRPDSTVAQDDEPPPKSDPDALLRWWKDSQAQYGKPSGGTVHE